MNTETHNHSNGHGHGDFERRDIGVAGVVYFFIGLAALTILAHFLLVGYYNFLDKKNAAEQAPPNPMVANAPTDTRKLPTDYRDYLTQNFASPQLEVDERTQLYKFRLAEEQTLNSYGWTDEKSKTVHIPIERAMDLIVQRGLPVRSEQGSAQVATNQKGNK